MPFHCTVHHRTFPPRKPYHPDDDPFPLFVVFIVGSFLAVFLIPLCALLICCYRSMALQREIDAEKARFRAAGKEPYPRVSYLKTATNSTTAG